MAIVFGLISAFVHTLVVLFFAVRVIQTIGKGNVYKSRGQKQEGDQNFSISLSGLPVSVNQSISFAIIYPKGKRMSC